MSGEFHETQPEIPYDYAALHDELRDAIGSPESVPVMSSTTEGQIFLVRGGAVIPEDGSEGNMKIGIADNVSTDPRMSGYLLSLYEVSKHTASWLCVGSYFVAHEYAAHNGVFRIGLHSDAELRNILGRTSFNSTDTQVYEAMSRSD